MRERRPAREQFVEEHAERVDVAARINVQATHLGLLGAHVGRRADELLERSVNGFVGQPLIGCCFGDPKIDYLGHRCPVMD